MLFKITSGTHGIFFYIISFFSHFYRKTGIDLVEVRRLMLAQIRRTQSRITIKLI